LPPDLRTVTRSGAPLRFGLAGGGIELSLYSDKFCGAVLNTMIDDMNNLLGNNSQLILTR